MPEFHDSLIGNLRSDNSHVHENIAENRDYPNSPCYLKEEDFGRSWREGNMLKFGQRW